MVSKVLWKVVVSSERRGSDEMDPCALLKSSFGAPRHLYRVAIEEKIIGERQRDIKDERMTTGSAKGVSDDFHSVY